MNISLQILSAKPHFFHMTHQIFIHMVKQIVAIRFSVSVPFFPDLPLCKCDLFTKFSG